MSARTALLALLLVLLVGCDSGSETVLARAPGGQTPVAGAIEFRGPNNEHLGMIGGGPLGHGYIGTLTPPSDGSGGDGGAVPAEFRLTSAYPNPTPGQATIEFSLPGATDVTVFVVAALPPGYDAPAQGRMDQSAWVYRPGGAALAVLSQGPRAAGFHEVRLDFGTMAGRPLPDGYFRVYVQTPYVIAWTDVLLDSTFSPF